jgi:hypothetical protein
VDEPAQAPGEESELEAPSDAHGFSQQPQAPWVDLVPGAQLVHLELDPPQLVLPNGIDDDVRALARYSDGSLVDVSDDVTWHSSSPAVASVSQSGLVTSAKPGSATISVSYEDATASAAVTITSAELQALSLSPHAMTLPAGLHRRAMAIGHFSDGSAIDLSGSATWSAYGSAVELSNDGSLMTVESGSAAVKATVGDVSGQLWITVTEATLVSIEVEAPPALTKGLWATFSAAGSYSDGSEHDVTDSVAWQSSDPLVAAISNQPTSKGQIQCLAAGEVEIGASLGAVSAELPVTVDPAALLALHIDPPEAMEIDEEQELHVTGHYSDGTSADVSDEVTWSSLSPYVALVSNEPESMGVVTSVHVGYANITASLGAVETSVMVHVTNTAPGGGNPGGNGGNP